MTGQTCSSSSLTIGTATNELSRYELIFIKSDKYNLYPINGIAIRNDTSNRENSTHFDSLNGKYMKGAGTGQNAGGNASVSTHNHSSSHSHTLYHEHAGANCGNVSSFALGGGETDSIIIRQHSHDIYFGSHSETVSNSDNLSSVTQDVAYRQMHFWKITSNSIPKVGDIALYTESVLPIGWTDLGYSNIYIKGQTSGGALSTGGSNTHTHSALTHSHVGSSHTHSYSSSTATYTGAYRNGGSNGMSGSHSHAGTTSAGSNSSTSSISVDTSTENQEPPYINARLIQMQFLSVAGSIINNFVG